MRTLNNLRTKVRNDALNGALECFFVMQLTGKVVASYYCGRSVALKTYPAARTADFKCWGSGSRNEEAVRRRLGRLVPELVQWQADDQAELAWLEWSDGEPPRAT